MEWISLLQWPAMATTVAASWCVASRSPSRRKAGFWIFLASNVLWVAWGWHDGAPALVVLQLALAAMNIRGAHKASSAEDEAAADAQHPPHPPHPPHAATPGRRPADR